MATDPELEVHKEWLGYLQPVGLVVSPPALALAQAFPDGNVLAAHNRFREHLEAVRVPDEDDPAQAVVDWPRFFTDVLGWETADLVGHGDAGPVPDALEVALPDYGEVLRPTYAVPEFEPGAGGERRWMMLIEVVPRGATSTNPRRTRAISGRPPRRRGSSGSCGRLRSPSGLSPTAGTSGSSTPRAGRRRGTSRSGSGRWPRCRGGRSSRRCSCFSRPTASSASRSGRGCRRSWPRAASIRTSSRRSSAAGARRPV